VYEEAPGFRFFAPVTRSLTVAPCAAAEGGSAEGQYEMGRMAFGARGGMLQTFKEAAKYWRLAAAQAWR